MSGLRKAKKYDWKDSNMALVGSDDDRRVKKESAMTEPAWKNAGQKVGLQVWRIESFKVKHWPKEDYGRFYNGDSYIVLNTYKPDPSSEKLAHDVHFWIGKYSTQDEYGTAAYKTVELDTLLDDVPVQHREVQSYESDRFMSYFSRFEILKGGAASGFRHVTPEEYKPRLLHFHGTSKAIKVNEIQLDRNKLCPEDTFLLDKGLSIFVWNGPEANKDERFKAMQYAQQLKSERSKGKVIMLNSDEHDTDFDETFSGENDDDDDDEEDEDDRATFEKTLFRLSDASGSLKFEEIGKASQVHRSQLDSKDVFILDSGKAVWVWIGIQASAAERSNGIVYAHNYLEKSQHPYVPVSVLKEGQESAEFGTAISA